MVNIPGLDSLNWGGLMSQMVYWLGYGLLLVLVMGLFVAVWMFMSYRYKVTILRRGGSASAGDKNQHFITKIKRDRAKMVKSKGITKWKLLFGRKTMPPVKYEDVYPGNNIFLYQSADNTFHPFKLKVSNPSANFEAIPSDVSFWMGLELQQVAQDYAKQDFWSKYGNIAVMMGTVLFCLILVGVTIYFTYDHFTAVINGAVTPLVDALKGVGDIKGVG